MFQLCNRFGDEIVSVAHKKVALLDLQALTVKVTSVKLQRGDMGFGDNHAIITDNHVIAASSFSLFIFRKSSLELLRRIDFDQMGFGRSVQPTQFDGFSASSIGGPENAIYFKVSFRFAEWPLGG